MWECRLGIRWRRLLEDGNDDAVLANFILVNRFASDGTFMGFMTASTQLDITYQTLEGWCTVAGALAEIGKILEAVPEVGGIIGDFFGAASVGCDWNKDIEVERSDL